MSEVPPEELAVLVTGINGRAQAINLSQIMVEMVTPDRPAQKVLFDLEAAEKRASILSTAAGILRATIAAGISPEQGERPAEPARLVASTRVTLAGNAASATVHFGISDGTQLPLMLPLHAAEGLLLQMTVALQAARTAKAAARKPSAP